MDRVRVGLLMLGGAVILHGMLSPLLLSRPGAVFLCLGGLAVLASAPAWRQGARWAAVLLLVLVIPLAVASTVDLLDPQTNIYADGIPVGEYPGGELWLTGLFAVPVATLTALSIRRGRLPGFAVGSLTLAGVGMTIDFLYDPMSWHAAAGMDAQIYAFVLLSAAHLLVLCDLWTVWRATRAGQASLGTRKGIEAWP